MRASNVFRLVCIVLHITIMCACMSMSVWAAVTSGGKAAEYGGEKGECKRAFAGIVICFMVSIGLIFDQIAFAMYYFDIETGTKAIVMRNFGCIAFVCYLMFIIDRIRPKGHKEDICSPESVMYDSLDHSLLTACVMVVAMSMFVLFHHILAFFASNCMNSWESEERPRSSVCPV